MAFAPGTYGQPSFNIGVDIMRVKLPQNELLHNFVESVGSQVKAIPLLPTQSSELQ
jgi:4'-phosphopantetheinyl transferase